MGLVYLLAFVSLSLEVTGLIGSHGILSAANYVAAISESTPDASRFFLEPTLVWFNSSDAFLQFLCWGGALAAVCVMGSVATAPLLVVTWVFYLSLVNVGQDFLSFQWDILLLESGFLAILWAPWQWTEPPWGRQKLVLTKQPKIFTAVIYLLRWLLFRLMFLSGSVKILSGDETWRNLSALQYHYVTQPLPTPLAWVANQLPLWFQSFSVAAVFFIEVCVPIMFFLPRRFRYAGAILTAFLQVLILSTGNYTFFNLLTLALCITLLDDQVMVRMLPMRVRSVLLEPAPETAPDTRRLPADQPLRTVSVSLAVALLAVAAVSQMAGSLAGYSTVPVAVRKVLAMMGSFHLVNGYGLFAVMTTSRPEISVEGSDDGVTWHPYVFKYKPGPLNRPPPVIAPLQPRLDWQMWFAALEPVQQSPWFIRFARCLLEPSPDVVHLLQDDPFHGRAPKFVRAELYDYQFTTLEEMQKTGNWWKRTPSGTFLPPISLDNFRDP
jgi:hypothetical protein